MSKCMTTGIILCWLLLAGGAGAQKIGVIDMKAIADRSQRIQSDLKKSQSQVQVQQDRLETKMNEMQRARQDLNARRTAMTDAEVAAQEEKLQELHDEYNDMQTAMNKQIGQIQRQVLRPQAERIQKIIGDVAREQSIDLVLDAEAVIFHSESVDITPQVIQIFDRQAGENNSTLQTAPLTPKTTKDDSTEKQKTETKSNKKQDSTSLPKSTGGGRKP